MTEKIREGNVFIFIDTEQKLVPISSNEWLHEKHDGTFFGNMEQLKQAIQDVIRIVQQNKWFGELEDCIRLYYSEGNPVCLRGDATIGLHRIEQSYEQDLYQFAHEFSHRCLRDKIPDEYLWFEETLCNLIGYIVMEKLYMMNVHENPQKAYKIKWFQMTNYSNIVPVIIPEVLKCPSEDLCRQVQVTLTRYLEAFILSNNEMLCDLQKLPKETCINFIEYLRMWKMNILEVCDAKIMLPDIMEKLYLRMIQTKK